MKTIRQFWNVTEAQFARSLLLDSDVPATLADVDTATLGPGYGGWGARLMVEDADVDRALRILDEAEGFEPLPDDFEPPPAPAEEPVQPVARPGTLSAFIWGGFGALVLVGLVVGAGGKFFADASAVLLVFAAGGSLWIIARWVYFRRHEEAATRRDGAAED